MFLSSLHPSFEQIPLTLSSKYVWNLNSFQYPHHAHSGLRHYPAHWFPCFLLLPMPQIVHPQHSRRRKLSFYIIWIMLLLCSNSLMVAQLTQKESQSFTRGYQAGLGLTLSLPLWPHYRCSPILQLDWSRLVFKCSQHISASLLCSNNSHCLGCLSPESRLASSFIAFPFLLKCHIVGKTFLNLPI